MLKLTTSSGRMYYHSPYFTIFENTTIVDLIQKINVSKIIRIVDDESEVNFKYKGCFYMMPVHSNVILLDDLSYQLYHLNEDTKILDLLCEEYICLQCMTGDIDFTFEFKYYSDGKLIRTFKFFEEPFGKEYGKVTVDYGDLLNNPSPSKDFKDIDKTIIDLVYDLGHEFLKDQSNLRNYYYEKV